MRIDKFLWCVRYFKTRSIATDEVKKNRVWINEEVAKPSKEVLVGDIVKVRKNQIIYTFEVLQIPQSRMGAKLVSLHIKDRTEKDQLDLLQLRKEAQTHYRKKGLGRPTKKDRRDLDDFMFDFDEEDDF
ncbi:RNA-binding S4 domain-containing protein [Ornithobacterium rhinotracheale]|uniref:RNA-binding S4 domain-containing protein n=1 Tax=Ornithobacterium rhinotracheale TaxID=28251 RepID=UPI00129D2097|nr:RNA-binding S4 domain-containing protein [Ornithobacterium rhinotracheale]MRI62838.1 RNA-binding S4 domain-containing protein [Ornithobacterium rhinotracheale]MRJ08256.1 RNA-binding S4 domain-containing protein [Ornithobacterium rhinotracheale]MRJ09896.1 RNA-binding S4 domain-containing protein [Ornithobacterium rhinotracheale]UOH78978.1 RNA-binding S4 domain-containing protein [Ornithobacterium rhinotracheale]